MKPQELNHANGPCPGHRSDPARPGFCSLCGSPCESRPRREASEQQQRTSSALAELAAMGSDVCALLAAVQGGATLVISGPDPLGSRTSPRFGATIQSATGAREAHATGSDLPRLLSDLAKSWSKQ